MGGKALKDSFELCQKILRNRRERTKVSVTLLKNKPLLLFFCFKGNFLLGNNLIIQIKRFKDICNISPESLRISQKKIILSIKALQIIKMCSVLVSHCQQPKLQTTQTYNLR